MPMQLDKPLITPGLLEGLNTGKVVVSDVGATIPGVTADTLQRFLLDLTVAVGAGTLHPDKLAVAVRSSGTDASSDALGADLADALWYAWQGVEGDASGDAKARVADAAKELLREQLVTKQQLLECGEGEFLEYSGLVVSKEGWRKKEIRSHTKHVYQQRKFNLLREESEGYAKLATLLNQQAAGRLTDATAPAVLDEVKALIGYFDLDPNRCFSVVLDAFSQQPDNDAFLHLMPSFSSDALTQLLGFHFSRCLEDSAAQRPAAPAPPGLYVAAAKLVRAGHTSLEALMAHLSPSDDELKQGFEEGSKRMAEGVARIGIISLVSAADTATAPLAPPGLGLRREPSGAMGASAAGTAGVAAGADSQQARSGLTASKLELAAAPFAAPLTAALGGSQKLLLLAAFLQIGDWERAQRLMRWLRASGLSDFAVFPAVGEALCSLIGRELQPVYAAATAPAGDDVTAAPRALSLPPRLLELLAAVGQHLYHNVAVLTKLVRVLAALLAANGGRHPRSKATHEQALQLLTQAVLPAMSLVPGNAGLVNEIWQALVQLPYTDRFCLYGDVKEAVRGSPLLTAAAKLAETEVRRILRRVTAPANKKEAKLTMKPLGRMLAKIMHAAPLAVAEQLIRQVMGMPGMVTSIVESLKYLTPMAFDVMTFAVLKQLASPKKKLKDDGVNLEEWYQWLAAFTGLLCKKHSEVEVVALLQYVANQLKSCESLDLLVLKEMVATMTGHQAVFDVSEHQLDALAGSDTLKAEVITQGEHRSSDKSLQRASARLLGALTAGEGPQERLAMPLLVLLAQQRKLIVLQSQSTHLKLIAELYDKCQEVCTQYAEFLQHALPLEEYAAILPSMEELAAEYKVDPELIFSLHRPLIRDILPPAALTGSTAGAAGADHEEEGEIADGGGGGAAGAADGAAAMEEDGQLEAGEVAASPGAGTTPTAGAAGAADAAQAAQRWAALEAAVIAMGAGPGGDEGPTFRGLTPTLYTTFWALTLYDLEVPTARYESTISQLRTDIRIAQGDIDSAKRDAQRPPPPPHYGGGFGFRGPPPAEGPGLTVDIDQLQKDIERAQAALAKLPGELKAQQANAAAVEQRLQREKGGWVSPDGRGQLPREFVQYCVLPRMLNSPTDALYCARFLKKVHQLDVPGFNLLGTINHVMREYGFLVRVCTAREATNFGIFMNEVLGLVERWRQADVFAKECATALTFKAPAKQAAAPASKATAAAPSTAAPQGGAAPAVGSGAQPVEAAAAAEGTPTVAEGLAAGDAEAAAAAPAATAAAPAAQAASRNVSHREFVNLCHNWQRRLTDEVFASCLKSRDYMQAKNALLALNRCVKVYPAIKFDASKLIEVLQPIRDKDPREDLKTLARMYCTALEMQMRDRSRNMVATREEYAGLPPKKRPARPAASKGGAAAASDGKPSAAAAATGEGSKKAGGERDKEGRDEARRGGEGSKGPALPPGMGVTARRGESERGQQQPAAERRRGEERGGPAPDGPPPGFSAADKLKHAGSSTELRRTAEAPAGGERERERRDRDRPQQGERGRGGRDERPPRPGAREEKKEAEDKDKDKEGRQQDRKGAASLRVDAAPFVPREGRPGSGGAQPAEEPAGGAEREAKRARREEPVSAAAGSTRERERGERGAAEREDRPGSRAAGAEREKERGSRERPSSRDLAADGAAAAAGGRADRDRERTRGSREEDKAAAAERSAQRAERAGSGGEAAGEGKPERERPSGGDGRSRRGEESSQRDAGQPSKRKREEEGAAAQRSGGRTAAAEPREQHARDAPRGAQDKERERERPRHASRDDKDKERERDGRGEGHRSHRGEAEPGVAAPTPAAEPGAEVEDARAAARAGHHRTREEREQRERADRGVGSPRGGAADREQPRAGRAERSGGDTAGPTSPADEADSGSGSSGSEDEAGRSKRRSRSGRKDKRKKDKEKKRKDKDKDKEGKDKKHGKRERSSEREATAAPVAPPAAKQEDERGSKRRRRDAEEASELPARLRGRLGSGGGGGLLGAALKGIAHDQQEQQQQERQQQERPERREPEPAPRNVDGSGGGARPRRGGGGRDQRAPFIEDREPRREVREVRDGRDGRRGGRNRR